MGGRAGGGARGASGAGLGVRTTGLTAGQVEKLNWLKEDGFSQQTIKDTAASYRRKNKLRKSQGLM